MFIHRFVFAVAASVLLMGQGFVTSPSSRTSALSQDQITLQGYVDDPGQTVTIQAVDQDTGVLEPVVPPTATVLINSPTKTYHVTYCYSGGNQLRIEGTPLPRPLPPPCTLITYTLYPWTWTGTLDKKYWAPQLDGTAGVPAAAGVPTSQGHLELFASVSTSNGSIILPTFSTEAFNAMQQSVEYTTDPEGAARLFSDGISTVLFDQYGVGGAPPSWTNVAGMILNPPALSICPPGCRPPQCHCDIFTFPPVAWSVGSYSVGPPSNSVTIYALVCAPTRPGNYPLVVYNHGGANFGLNSALKDQGSLHGNLTSAGWTSQPKIPQPGSPPGTPATIPLVDDLGQCLDWAKHGWIFAMSSYRAESIYITLDNNQPPYGTWSSNPPTKADQSSEFCMGEVTDVMALVDLLVNHIDTVTLGDPNNSIHVATNGKLFMYGYSHGGCITYRAVEQGAPVNAFAVVEGFTDLSLNYVNTWSFCQAQHATNSSACNVPTAAGTMVYDPTGVAAGSSGAVDKTGKVPYYPDTSGVMGYNWRSAHYFASRGDLSIQKFRTMPILIFHGDNDTLSGDPSIQNPVPLNEPLELAADINASEIFVGSNAPGNEACIAPPQTGKPIVKSNYQPLPGVPATCPTSFTIMDPTDACLGGSPAQFGANLCSVITLPKSPPHYLVVYHNMDHVNGGLGIEDQFDTFVEQNFSLPPGCDGVPTASGPIECKN